MKWLPLSMALLMGIALPATATLVPAPPETPAETPPTTQPEKADNLFAQSNLAAWCIVPFDSKKRGPEDRAAMLEALGFKKFAYDYREEHIPTFDAELEALKKRGIELTAWWFPGGMNDEARLILDVCRRHNVHPDLWVTHGVPSPPPGDVAAQAALVESEAAALRPIAEAAAAAGCRLGLYNHGGWFGEPDNQLAIVARLERDGLRNVGLVYNLHHGHGDLRDFPALLARMKPHLLALNLNGMSSGGEAEGGKIMPIGQGDLDASLLKAIQASGWRGPVGILNHTDEDAEARLQDNLDGLRWLEKEMAAPGSGGPRPVPRSWKAPASVPPKLSEFPYVRDPLQPDLWPHWKEHMNRDRLYDFYGKEARWFRDHPPTGGAGEAPLPEKQRETRPTACCCRNSPASTAVPTATGATKVNPSGATTAGAAPSWAQS